jgi:hypothetical protein
MSRYLRLENTILMYPDSEILFPARCITELRNLRPGVPWRELIDRISTLHESHEDVLSFSLMMIRLNNCLTCDLDSYRASLGCGQCARRTIQGYKGNDKELLTKLEEARSELHIHWRENHRSPGATEQPAHIQTPSTKSKTRGKR